MATSQLPNYLRAHRKRLGLSQEEVAFLLGTESGAKVCRHERFTCEPMLRTALAFEIVFDTSASELFKGLYLEVEREVAARARKLVAKLKKGEPSARALRKCGILSLIASENETHPQP